MPRQIPGPVYSPAAGSLRSAHRAKKCRSDRRSRSASTVIGVRGPIARRTIADPRAVVRLTRGEEKIDVCRVARLQDVGFEPLGSSKPSTFVARDTGSLFDELRKAHAERF